jgi:hypothetical protein
LIYQYMLGDLFGVEVGGAPRSQRATLQVAMFLIAQMEVLTAGKERRAGRRPEFDSSFRLA